MRPSVPRARICRSGIDPSDVPRASATATACLRHSGSSGRNSSITSPSRSSSAEKTSGLSEEAGRQERTRKDGRRAVCTRYFHTIVLPIPMSPVMATAAGSPEPAERKAQISPTSASRPMGSESTFHPQSVVTRLPAYEKPALGPPMILGGSRTTRPAHVKRAGREIQSRPGEWMPRLPLAPPLDTAQFGETLCIRQQMLDRYAGMCPSVSRPPSGVNRMLSPGRCRLVRQGTGQSEVGEQAVVAEPGDGADLVAGQSRARRAAPGRRLAGAAGAAAPATNANATASLVS